MRISVKLTLSSAAVMLVAGATIAGVAASGATPGVATGSEQPANAHPRLATPAAAPIDTAIQSTYTPIAPCRIVDTRVHGGAIRNNGIRSFRALGTTGFAAQGGQSCAIPRSATAVTGSVIATRATGSGYLTVYAYKAPAPNASFLNFTKSLTLSASGTIPVNAGSRDFTVQVSGHETQVVIQLTGYYIAPMWARINPNGTKGAGSRIVSTAHVATGGYQIDFDRAVTGCAFNATGYYAGDVLEVQPRAGDAHAVFVHSTVAASSASVDTAFYLTVTC